MSEIKNAIHNAISSFKKTIRDEMSNRCKGLCEELLSLAIRNRESAPKKHNFTGNFINSIVVILCEKGKVVSAFYASDKIGKKAIAVKMTRRKGTYRFSNDFENTSSVYSPKVDTNEGFGVHDAERFVMEYRGNGKNMFEIVVGYPVEYASYIELKRHTAGFIETRGMANSVSVKYLTI